MSWLKQGDELDRDRRYKRFRRGKDRLLHIGIFTIIGTWSAGELSDGVVPFYVPVDYGITPAMVNRMIDAGLWHVDTKSCPECSATAPPPRDHFVICQWWIHLEDRETVLRRRKLDADRKKAKREREMARAEADLRELMSGTDTRPDSALESDPESAWDSGVPARPGLSRPGPSEVVTEGGQAHEPAARDSGTPPRYRCKTHAQLPAEDEGPNCIGCKNVRLAAEAAADAAIAERRRTATEAQLLQTRLAAEARREAAELIVACDHCNDRGMRPGPEVAGRRRGVLCDHPDIRRKAG